VSLDDWILALHVLSAFALVAAMVVFWVLTFAPVAAAAEPGLGLVSRIATVAVSVGALGTLVFGIWLALSVGGYEIWDGWILAGLVLWAIGTETGRRGGLELAAGRRERGLVLQTIASVAVLLVLVDMIWKPGA
jgi:hypothetical protein